nr:immunoglobulin heavy chain junction region [Mus musculus]
CARWGSRSFAYW